MTTLAALVATCADSGVAIKDSNIAGVGLFLDKDAKKGARLAVYGGVVTVSTKSLTHGARPPRGNAVIDGKQDLGYDIDKACYYIMPGPTDVDIPGCAAFANSDSKRHANARMVWHKVPYDNPRFYYFGVDVAFAGVLTAKWDLPAGTEVRWYYQIYDGNDHKSMPRRINDHMAMPQWGRRRRRSQRIGSVNSVV